MEKQLDISPKYFFHAYHITDTLKLKDIDRFLESAATIQTSTRLVYKDRENSYFFIYRFGSVIFFNVDPSRQSVILGKIKMVVGQKQEILTSEEFTVEVRSDEKCRVDFERAVLDKLTLERLDLLALILAQSTALEYFEIKVDDLLKQAGDIGQSLQQKGHFSKAVRDIKKFIGYCITTKQDLVASLYLLDKPDITWDDQMLDTLYRGAVDMFELRDRYKTIDYKLRMIQENLQLISELLQYRNANFLEWAIIVLIAAEIVLFVWQMFFLKH